MAVGRFEKDPEVPVLLLGREGSTGLDKTKVARHIVLMEALWDEAQEKQVRTAAHESGAVQALEEGVGGGGDTRQAVALAACQGFRMVEAELCGRSQLA